MAKLILPVAILLSMSLDSCARPPFWVPGLEMPATATVSSAVTLKINGPQDIPQDVGSIAAAKQILVVTFDYPGGWQGVCGYFDAEMDRLGFVLSRGPAELGPQDETMHTYSKADGSFDVEVIDLSQLKDPQERQAGYKLCVIDKG